AGAVRGLHALGHARGAEELLEHAVERAVVELDALFLAALPEGPPHVVRVRGPLHQEREDRERERIGDLPSHRRGHIYGDEYTRKTITKPWKLLHKKDGSLARASRGARREVPGTSNRAPRIGTSNRRG